MIRSLNFLYENSQSLMRLSRWNRIFAVNDIIFEIQFEYLFEAGFLAHTSRVLTRACHRKDGNIVGTAIFNRPISQFASNAFTTIVLIDWYDFCIQISVDIRIRIEHAVFRINVLEPFQNYIEFFILGDSESNWWFTWCLNGMQRVNYWAQWRQIKMLTGLLLIPFMSTPTISPSELTALNEHLSDTDIVEKSPNSLEYSSDKEWLIGSS